MSVNVHLYIREYTQVLKIDQLYKHVSDGRSQPLLENNVQL